MNLLRSLIDAREPLKRRLIRGLLLALVIAACGYRAWLVFHFNPIDHIWSDPGRHWYIGTRALDLQPLAAIDPVGYQVYIGILGKITARVPVLVAYWTAWLSVIGPWFWYRFLRELQPSRDLALLGWLLLAALPSWTAIYSYFMQETLMLPLLGAALWASWRCRRKASVASFVVATGIWLMAGLTRGICLPLGAVTLAWLWFAQGRKLAKASASIALVLAVMGPLAGRSWSLARLVSPHGIGQMVQLYQRAGTKGFTIEFTRQAGKERWTYEFTSPAMLNPPLAPLSMWPPARPGTVHFRIDLDAGRRDWQSEMDAMPPWDLRRRLRLTGENLVHLFFGPSWPDTNRERAIGVVNYWSRWIWAPLTLICLVATAVLWRRQRDWLLAALMLTWFVVQGLFPLAVNEGRYRKPFEGLLIAQCLLLVASGTRSARRRAAEAPVSHGGEGSARE